MKASCIAFLCVAAVALGEGREAPCQYGYCMGQKMYADADGVNPADGLLITLRERSAEESVMVYWAPKAGVCAVAGLHSSSHPFTMMRVFTAMYAEAKGEPTLQTDRLAMWMEPAYGVNLMGVGVTKEGKVIVSFRFANFDACVEEMQD